MYIKEEKVLKVHDYYRQRGSGWWIEEWVTAISEED